MHNQCFRLGEPNLWLFLAELEKSIWAHTLQTPNDISRKTHLLSMDTYREDAERPHIFVF